MVLGLWKNSKDSAETSHVFYTQSVLSVTPYTSVIHLPKLMNKYWYLVINKSLYCILISLAFAWFFVVLWFCLEYHVTFSYHVSSAPLSCDSFSHFCLMTLSTWRNTRWVFRRLSPNGDLSDIFLTISLGLWFFLEKDHKGEALFSSLQV